MNSNYGKPAMMGSLHLDANMGQDEVEARIDAFLRETFGDDIVDQSEEIDESCPVCGENHGDDGFIYDEDDGQTYSGDDHGDDQTSATERAPLAAYVASSLNQDETLEKMAKLLGVCVAKLGGSVVVTQDEIECLEDTNLVAQGSISDDFEGGDITITLVNA